MTHVIYSSRFNSRRSLGDKSFHALSFIDASRPLVLFKLSLTFVCVCVCVCVCLCVRTCVCVFCMHTAHHTWGSGYRSGPVFFKSECPWIGDLKFQLPGVGFSVSEFQSHINALRCSGGSECAGVRCVLHRVLQPGWCSNPRERARQRDCDRKMESKKKTPDKQSGRERTSESPLVWSVALRVGDFEL